MSAASFRTLLQAGDVNALRKAWTQVAPHLPQPASYEQAEIVMHHARTQAGTITLKARAWSHRWLVERDLPSGLPDDLKPQAERLYPRVAEAVGISVRTRNAYFQPAAAEAQKAMEGAVEQCYADRRTDPAFVKARMAEAKDKTYKALFGVTHVPK